LRKHQRKPGPLHPINKRACLHSAASARPYTLGATGYVGVNL
jgi:hypothetical protein